MKRRRLIHLVLLIAGMTMNYAFAQPMSISPVTDKNVLRRDMERVLSEEWDLWYPRSIDSADGGFFSDLNYRWEVVGEQDKMIVTQARHVWATANAAMFYQEDNTFRSIARHGVDFLRDRMWDREFGGFYDLVSKEGTPRTEHGHIVKRAYGNAFAIYGLAAYFHASGDTASLNLAQETFRWLEKHSYDPRHGGYFQFMNQDGTPFTEGYENIAPKDQNSTIHLLEALTELYRVWPDPVVKERLTALLHIVRDTITTQHGYMALFFRRDWTPISFRDSSQAAREGNYALDHVSFGHDIETAYLMLEASEALGIKDDVRTLAVAKKMVDHSLRYGWDQDRGGLYDGGYDLDGMDRLSIVRNTKEWWAQAEALNSCLLMSELFPHDPMHYADMFRAQWEYCRNYVIDGEHGGWYWGGIDIVPGNRLSPKSTIWKCNYHTSRALINCIQRLRHESLDYATKRFEPVNANASPEARKLLEFLYSLRGKKIVAGHHNNVGKPDAFIERVKELSGRSPEIWGGDFIDYSREGSAARLVREATAKHRDGYIVTLMWHAGRPQDNPPFGWKESVQAKLTDSEWKELTTPGTELHARWVSQVDTVAKYLKELQTLGIPILWRPYHEANGVWFWWGNRKGPDGSAKLYRMMYDRLVNYHRLNNLIWVWDTNAPRQLIDDEAYAYKEFFPGLDVIDVLATDVYHGDYRQSHHDGLVELGKGKLIALGEVGEVPSPEIFARQPMWSWFMIWGDLVDTHNTPRQIRDIYNYPGTFSHEDMDAAR